MMLPVGHAGKVTAQDDRRALFFMYVMPSYFPQLFSPLSLSLSLSLSVCLSMSVCLSLSLSILLITMVASHISVCRSHFKSSLCFTAF